jgi:hypothetical protein
MLQKRLLPPRPAARRLVSCIAAAALAASVGGTGTPAFAEGGREFHNSVGGKHVPLQELVRKRRPRGPVQVAVPTAYTYGLGGPASAGSYCSPTIRMSNSSAHTVEELVVGIEYRHQSSGKAAGSTVTRMTNLDVGEQDTQYFHRLGVRECDGLTGELTVVRCVYAHGVDCTADVVAVGFGAVPLQKKPPVAQQAAPTAP